MTRTMPRAATCLLLLALGGGALWVWHWDEEQKALHSDIPFDADAWRAGDAELRSRMAKDLARTQPFLACGRSDVLAKLGPPDLDLGDSCLYYGGWKQVCLCFRKEGNSTLVILD